MLNLTDFTDKQILVTGASSGIGRETAILISRLGGRVIATARNSAELDKTISQMEGGNHVKEIFDLNEIDHIWEWLLSVVGNNGRIHGLAHLAGLHEARPLKISESEFVEKLFRVNVASTIGLVRAFRNKNVRGENASVVLVSSIAALIGESGISVYSATKGAIISLTKSLAAELSKENIRVNCVSPSIVKTEMLKRFHKSFTDDQLNSIESLHPLGFGEPIDVAMLIAFVLSDAAKWMTGSNLVLDGGYSLQ